LTSLSEKAKVGLTHHSLQNLDVEYQRLAKIIPLPSDEDESAGIEAAAKALGEKKMAAALRSAGK
jgi:hypothetical protein